MWFNLHKHLYAMVNLKNYYINGVQGRYFIELLLPFMLVLGQNKLVKESGKINLVKVISYAGVT